MNPPVHIPRQSGRIADVVKGCERENFPCFSDGLAYILSMLRIVVRFTGGFVPGVWSIAEPSVDDIFAVIQALISTQYKDDKYGQIEMVGVKGIDYLFNLSDIDEITFHSLEVRQ